MPAVSMRESAGDWARVGVLRVAPCREGGFEVERCVVQGAGQGVGLGGWEPDGERVRELQAGTQDEPDLPAGHRDADVDVADELVAVGVCGQVRAVAEQHGLLAGMRADGGGHESRLAVGGHQGTAGNQVPK